MATAVSSLVVTESSLASGTSFTGVIVIETVAESVPPLPSSTSKTKLSAPLKLMLGVYVRSGAVPDSVPLAGGVVTV